MKRTAVFTMAALCGCVWVVSCDNNPCNVNIDPAPTPVCIIVEDAAGNNLLDADYEGNILGNDIYIPYLGTDYHLVLSAYTPDQDDIMYTGLHTGAIGTDEVPGMLFWYFYADDTDRETGFTINWGDGTLSAIKFSYYYTVVNCAPVYHRKIYLDGVLQSEDSLTVTIVKQPV